jgi:hypothetical protein
MRRRRSRRLQKQAAHMSARALGDVSSQMRAHMSPFCASRFFGDVIAGSNVSRSRCCMCTVCAGERAHRRPGAL